MTVQQPQNARLRPFRPVPFGRYTLLSPLAMGGMGEIFLARLEGAQGFEKLCVIKRILPQMARDPEFVERFVNEARILVKLSHGSIAQVLDVGLHEGDPYIALEFVDGKDLRKISARARDRDLPLPLTFVLYAMGRVLDALAYAHRKRDDDEKELGLVHRDVSPQNILISYEGEVKVIDFGLAKSSLSSAKTNPSMILGKFLYMSPEQARHQKVDRRSDLYSAGLCLYELVCGRNPFDEVPPHELMSVVANPVISPIHTIDPLCPAPVQEMIARALELDPAKRFQTAEEFRGRIQACLLEIDPSAGPESVTRYMREAFAAEYAQERRMLASLRSLARPEEEAVAEPAEKSRNHETAVVPLKTVAPSEEAARALASAPPPVTRPTIVDEPILPAPLSFAPTPRTREDDREALHDGETVPGVIVTEELRQATLPSAHDDNPELPWVSEPEHVPESQAAAEPEPEPEAEAEPSFDTEQLDASIALQAEPETTANEQPSFELPPADLPDPEDPENTRPRAVMPGFAVAPAPVPEDTQPRVVVGTLLEEPFLPPPEGRVHTPTRTSEIPVLHRSTVPPRRPRPVTATRDPEQEVITGQLPTEDTGTQELPRGRSRALLMFAVVVFVGGTLAVGGWFAWDFLQHQNRPAQTTGPTQLKVAPAIPRAAEKPAPPPAPTSAQPAPPTPPPAAPPEATEAPAPAQAADGTADLIESLTPPKPAKKPVQSAAMKALKGDWAETQRLYRVLSRRYTCEARKMRMLCSRYAFLAGELSSLDDDSDRVAQLRTEVRRLESDLRVLARKGR